MKKPVGLFRKKYLMLVAAVLTPALLWSGFQHTKDRLYTKSRKMKVEIWSDVVCPWCYIGKRKFESALKAFPHAGQVELEWKSYQLSPNVKTDPSVSIYDYLAREKNISLEQSKRMHDQVKEIAATVGLQYNFDKVVPVNTYKAHRFLHFAKEQGKQAETTEKISHAYFTDGLNVDENEVLMEIAKQVGLNTDGLSEILASDEFGDRVRADIEEGHQLGLRGVPFFVFNRQYGVSGAQDPSFFLQTLEKAYKDWKEEE